MTEPLDHPESRECAAPLDPAALVASARVYALPMRTRFRGITERSGVLLPGPRGWGEFCPFDDYDDATCVSWLETALEAAHRGWPAPVRSRIPVNCTVPVVPADQAYALVVGSGCTTAKVKVADPAAARADRNDARATLAGDLARVEAVRAALGPTGRIRLDANGAWDVDTAVRLIREFERAANGLEYVEQPCRLLEELAAVRRKVEVPIAADESIRLAADPLRVPVAEAADVAILKAAPLGGVRRALRVAESTGLPCVVSSALETSVGLAAELALAGALPELPYACGLGTRSLLADDVVAARDSAHPIDGYLPVPTAPPVPDLEPERWSGRAARPELEAYWRERLARVLARARRPDA